MGCPEIENEMRKEIERGCHLRFILQTTFGFLRPAKLIFNFVKKKNAFAPLSGNERREIEIMMAGKRSPRLRKRAEIIYLAAKGTPQIKIAEQLGTSRLNVRRWTRRFFEMRMAGLLTQPGRGPKSGGADLKIRIEALLLTPPDGGHEFWNQHLIAENLGVSDATVSRAFRKYGFWVSGAKIRKNRNRQITEAIAGFYLDPPVRVLALFPESGEKNPATRLNPVIKKLAQRIDELEQVLANTERRDGRTVVLGRFLEEVSKRAAGKKVELIWESLNPAMIEQVAGFGFTRRVCDSSGAEPSWVLNGLKDLNYGENLGAECGDMRRQIERLLHRVRDSRLRLRRPFFLLYKRMSTRAA
jgi:hypothetical protein